MDIDFKSAILVSVLCGMAASAGAEDFTRSAESGQPTKMFVYKSWTRGCKSKPGIVKVLSKPAHGKIIPKVVEAKIGLSRVNPERTAHCVGEPTEGFRVDYVSEPGFKGSDHFTIQFFYGRRVDVDNYTVDVR